MLLCAPRQNWQLLSGHLVASAAAHTGRSDSAPADPNANFVLTALRETGDLVTAALGGER